MGHVECPQSEPANNDLQPGRSWMVAATNCERMGYQSVQRFVRKLKATQPQRVWRMEARPGEGNFRAFQFSYSNNAIRNVTLTMFVTSTLFVTAASISNPA